jgi:hypothetical protein
MFFDVRHVNQTSGGKVIKIIPVIVLQIQRQSFLKNLAQWKFFHD